MIRLMGKQKVDWLVWQHSTFITLENTDKTTCQNVMIDNSLRKYSLNNTFIFGFIGQLWASCDPICRLGESKIFNQVLNKFNIPQIN